MYLLSIQGLHNCLATSRLMVLTFFSNIVVVKIVVEIIVLVELDSEFLLLSLESEEKQVSCWFLSIIISMLSLSLDASTTFIFDVCLCYLC